MEEIFVTGGNHHNTLGVIRSLGYKGILSNLIIVGNSKRQYVKYSKFIKRTFEAKDEEEAIKILIGEKNYLTHAVVVACSDGMASAIDLHRDELSDVYSIPGSSVQGAVHALMDKEIMSQTGKRIGFKVPDSWVVKRTDVLTGIEYPCITKPIKSINGHKSDIKICHSQEDLERLLENAECDCFQIQRYIEKQFEYQLIGVSLNEGKEIIIPGVSKCIRPCSGTNTGYLHYESLEGIKPPVEECLSFIRQARFSGLFSMEFIRSKDGDDYFLETNFRNDGNSICVTASGTNLPYIWYLASSGIDYHEELRSSSFVPVYVMPEFNDFREFVLHRKITLKDWFDDIRKTDKFMEFDLHDIKPFVIESFNMFLIALNRICKKS